MTKFVFKYLKLVVFGYCKKFVKSYNKVGVFMSRFSLGLCSTRNRPDLVEWQGDEPTVDHEKSRVKSDQAWVHSGRIQFQPKDKDQRPQISQIWKNKSTLKNRSTNPNTSNP